MLYRCTTRLKRLPWRVNVTPVIGDVQGQFGLCPDVPTIRGAIYHDVGHRREALHNEAIAGVPKDHLDRAVAADKGSVRRAAPVCAGRLFQRPRGSTVGGVKQAIIFGYSQKVIE